MWYHSERKSCDVMMEAKPLLVTKGKGNTTKKKVTTAKASSLPSRHKIYTSYEGRS